eukprot:NODE_8565_length_1485_cov_17.821060.p1 GENE.NODE_8565_length_1485_cov_17.821060~~NODE_8565_length_1485_cov_17.821060.p1  ORF type:complete len:390 (-),score=55.30 NODE_8565_length_1485_cov_17.821060:207-1376(-)
MERSAKATRTAPVARLAQAPRLHIATTWLLLALLLLLRPGHAGVLRGLGVADLTTPSFQPYVDRNPKVLVDFYDPSDVQWPAMKADLDGALKDARSHGYQVPIVRVDVTAEPTLAKQFVASLPYPQLLWFKHGKPTQYHRYLRSRASILTFLVALDRAPIQVFEDAEKVRKSANRAVFAQVPRQSDMYKVLEVVALRHMDVLEVAFHDSPTLSIEWLEVGKERSVYVGAANVDELDRWVCRQLVISEPIPESQDGDSIDVVGMSFSDIVLRPSQDVFLLVYAPWCGFSKKLLPVWEALARSCSKAPNLVVAKMDGDRNRLPTEDFSWTAYPAVFFVQAGTRLPMVYHGPRTVSSFMKFAKEFRKADWNLPDKPEEEEREEEDEEGQGEL